MKATVVKNRARVEFQTYQQRSGRINDKQSY